MKILTMFATSTLCLASQVASAQEPSYYLGAGFGKSAIDFNGDDFSTQSETIKSTATQDIGYKIFGGYNFNKNWALEVGYAELGKFRYQVSPIYGVYYGNIYNFDYKASSWSMAAKGNLPIADQISVFGKLGVTLNRAHNTFVLDDHHIEPPLVSGATLPKVSNSSIFAKPGSYTKTRFGMLIGVGAEYTVSSNIAVRLEYEDFGKFGDQYNTGRAKLSIWSLGGVCKF